MIRIAFASIATSMIATAILSCSGGTAALSDGGGAVASKDILLSTKTCSQNNGGEVVLVTGENTDYVCTSVDHIWGWYESVATYARLEVCADSILGLSDYVAQDAAVYECTKDGWTKKQTSSGSSSSTVLNDTNVATLIELNSLLCAKNNSGETHLVTETSSEYSCLVFSAGGLNVANWYPSVSTFSRLGVCNQAKTGTFAYVQTDKTIYQCVNESWAEIVLPQTDLSSSSFVTNGSSSIQVSNSMSSSIQTSNSSSSSSLASSASKVVTFEDGILWTPSYGKRARTFFNIVDEYSFWSPNSVTQDSSGWWEKYIDNVENGTSVATGTFSTEYLNLAITLHYGHYKQSTGFNYVTGYSYTYNEPVPYPYGGFQFPLSTAAGGYSNLSTWTGLCITYTSTDKFAFSVRSAQTDLGDGMHWESTIPASSVISTAEILFSSLTRSMYATTVVTRDAALQKVTGFQIAYRNDEAQITCPSGYSTTTCNSQAYSASNNIKVYKIGKAGTCSTGSL